MSFSGVCYLNLKFSDLMFCHPPQTPQNYQLIEVRFAQLNRNCLSLKKPCLQ